MSGRSACKVRGLRLPILPGPHFSAEALRSVSPALEASRRQHFGSATSTFPDQPLRSERKGIRRAVLGHREPCGSFKFPGPSVILDFTTRVNKSSPNQQGVTHSSHPARKTPGTSEPRASSHPTGHSRPASSHLRDPFSY